jgi:hypothetical protein
LNNAMFTEFADSSHMASPGNAPPAAAAAADECARILLAAVARHQRKTAELQERGQTAAEQQHTLDTASSSMIGAAYAGHASAQAAAQEAMTNAYIKAQKAKAQNGALTGLARTNALREKAIAEKQMLHAKAPAEKQMSQMSKPDTIANKARDAGVVSTEVTKLFAEAAGSQKMKSTKGPKKGARERTKMRTAAAEAAQAAWSAAAAAAMATSAADCFLERAADAAAAATAPAAAADAAELTAPNAALVAAAGRSVVVGLYVGDVPSDILLDSKKHTRRANKQIAKLYGSAGPGTPPDTPILEIRPVPEAQSITSNIFVFNLPFDNVQVEDVTALFHGFEVASPPILQYRRHKFSGRATVPMSTPAEAARAVEVYGGGKLQMRDRRVSVCIARETQIEESTIRKKVEEFAADAFAGDVLKIATTKSLSHVCHKISSELGVMSHNSWLYRKDCPENVHKDEVSVLITLRAGHRPDRQPPRAHNCTVPAGWQYLPNTKNIKSKKGQCGTFLHLASGIEHLALPKSNRRKKKDREKENKQEGKKDKEKENKEKRAEQETEPETEPEVDLETVMQAQDEKTEAQGWDVATAAPGACLIPPSPGLTPRSRKSRRMKKGGYNKTEAPVAEPETGKQVQETGKQVQETGKQVQETGKQVQEAGKQVQETGKQVQVQETGNQVQETGKQVQVQETGKQVQETGKQVQDAQTEAQGWDAPAKKPKRSQARQGRRTRGRSKVKAAAVDASDQQLLAATAAVQSALNVLSPTPTPPRPLQDGDKDGNDKAGGPVEKSTKQAVTSPVPGNAADAVGWATSPTGNGAGGGSTGGKASGGWGGSVSLGGSLAWGGGALAASPNAAAAGATWGAAPAAVPNAAAGVAWGAAPPASSSPGAGASPGLFSNIWGL